MQECPECHAPIEECSERDKDWYPQRRIDYKQAALAVARRAYEKRHEERQWHDGTFPSSILRYRKDWSLDTPYRYDDGVTILVSETDDAPEDYFMGRPGEEVPSGGTS